MIGNYFSSGFILLLIIFYNCTGRETCRKSVLKEGRDIITDSAMVVSAHRESSLIGMAILRKGGNAVDAAVSTEFALAVCYPEAGNIGGGGFMLIRNADGITDMIDYREKAPRQASRNMYLDNSGNVVAGLSTETRLASGIPGTVDGMISVHSKYGILTFKEVIQPAIDLARRGFPVTAGQAADLNSNMDIFIERNGRDNQYVRNTPWKEGDTLRQPDLAGTLERIRDHGRDGFYSGTTARLIIREMQQENGIITMGDLAGYKAVFRDPVKADYEGFRIISASPPSGGGIILLQVLGMIEPYDLKEMGFHTSSSIHLIAEAERRAFADRAMYLGDPEFTDIPVQTLLNSEYLSRRMIDFDQSSASLSSDIHPGTFAAEESGETTHYSVVDALGNAVAATTTLNGTFGSSIIVDSAGFLMNNQMDDFSLKPGVPNMYGLIGGEANSIGPGKRMLSSMTPVIIEKDGKLLLVAGSPGGSTIPTSVIQVVVNIIDYEMTVRQAVDTGRFHHQWLPDQISFESTAIDTSTLNELEKMGHKLVPRQAIGRVNAILILPDGRRAAGADRRGRNSACGY